MQCHYTSLSNILGEQKRYRHLIRETSRRSLSLARTNHSTILATKRVYLARIEQAEEYIGLLRQECALMDMDLVDADDDIAEVRGVLSMKAIAECSLSEDEDESVAPVYPPRSSSPSDPTKGSSPGRSSSSSDSYPIHYGSDDALPDDGIEVAGEWANDSENHAEGGIERLARHVSVKGFGN